VSILDIKIRQNWSKDGYTFEKGEEVDAPSPEVTANPAPTFQSGGVIAPSFNTTVAITPATPTLVAENVNGEDVRQGTLAAWALIQKDSLIEVLMDIVANNCPLFEMLEFQGIQGNALRHSVGVSPLVAHCSDVRHTSTDPNHKVAAISSQAKSVARLLEEATVRDMQALAFAKRGVLKSGSNITYQLLDDMLDIQSKPSFFLGHASAIRDFRTMQSNRPGATTSESVQLPSGRVVPAYRGVPFVRSDYMDMWRLVLVEMTELTRNGRGDGVCGIMPDPCPMNFQTIGKDHDRIKMYAGTAAMSDGCLVLGEYARAP
jgi:hypothetical protein